MGTISLIGHVSWYFAMMVFVISAHGSATAIVDIAVCVASHAWFHVSYESVPFISVLMHA